MRRIPDLQVRTNLPVVLLVLPQTQETIMARFWLFITNTIGILILVLLVVWLFKAIG